MPCHPPTILRLSIPKSLLERLGQFTQIYSTVIPRREEAVAHVKVCQTLGIARHRWR